MLSNQQKLKKGSFLIILFYLLLLNPIVFSQSHPKKSSAVKCENSEIIIDGNLDETYWDLPPWSTNFLQKEPYEGQFPSQLTSFKVLYDKKNIYIAVFAYDSIPSAIESHVTRRDEFSGDFIQISIDSYHDHMTAFCFILTASGVKGDMLISGDGESFDLNWDAIWEGKSRINNEGWIAEFKIPFSQLRFPNKEEQIWGFQVGRMLYRMNEISQWALISKQENGWVKQFGDLEGVSGIEPQTQIEIKPFIFGKSDRYLPDSDNPFKPGVDYGFNAGLDGKVGITSNMILDFTINPDFGQVEADPSEVNLTSFETYFKEKRPFFIEGKQIMDFQMVPGNGNMSSDNLFYSRRIGRNPQNCPDIADDEYLKSPEKTRIIGAAKITGKNANGLSVGFLESITARETAKHSINGEKSNIPVEPFSNYSLLSLKKELDSGNTIIGGMATLVNRSQKDKELLILPKKAYSGGLDFLKYWGKKTWFLNGKLIGSYLIGDSSSITEIQQSGVHFFQRPDLKHIKIDSSKTKLAGHGGTIMGGRIGGGHFQGVLWITWRSPGLELNDMGYLRRSDEIQQVFWSRYQIWKPIGIFRTINFDLNQWAGMDFGGNVLYKGAGISTNMQFKNSWFFGSGFNRNSETLSPFELQGGPALLLPGSWNYWFSINTDQRKKIYSGFQISANDGDNNFSNSRNFSFSLSSRPFPNLHISLQPFLRIYNTELQYVDQASYKEKNIYICSDLEHKTMGVIGRINYSIRPEISLQFYAEPFISAGKYQNFKIISNPVAGNVYERYVTLNNGELSFDKNKELYNVDQDLDGNKDYSFSEPDFNIGMFRSNLVFRWEFAPGSTFFVVWSQNRSDSPENHKINYREDVNSLFNTYPYNVFLVKLAYTIIK